MGHTEKDRPASAGMAGAVEGELTMKRKQPMPRYYGRNIVQNAQKKFLQRKALEDRQKRIRDRLADAVDGGRKE